MSKSMQYFVIPVLLAALTIVLVKALPVGAAPSNGHVDLTLKTTPDRPVVGQETRFVVTLTGNDRQPVANAAVLVSAEMLMAEPSMSGTQHGHTSSAPSGQAQLSVTAQPSDKPGEYLATLTLTDEGEWKIIATGGDSTAELTVTAINAQPTAGQSAAAKPATAQTGQGTSVKVASASVKLSLMEAVHASYLELSGNIADLRARVDLWKKGDADSLNIAHEKLERIEAVLARPTWPAEMAKSIEKTEGAVKAMTQALKDKDVAAAEAASKVLGDGSNDVTHDYFGNWLPSVQLGADEGKVATARGKTVAKGHDDDGHGAAGEASGPNYYFVGSTLGVVLITIVLVPILRRRDLRGQQGEAA